MLAGTDLHRSSLALFGLSFSKRCGPREIPKVFSSVPAAMEYLMQTFPERSYEVTNFVEKFGAICCCIITRRDWLDFLSKHKLAVSCSLRVVPRCGWQQLARKMLDLQSEEVVLRTQNCCCNVTQRRPYAQLTLLEERSMCWGTCAAINSDLAPMNDKGEGGIVPGCGCDQELVQEVVRELNLRKDGRGKVAQMRRPLAFKVRSQVTFVWLYASLIKVVGHVWDWICTSTGRWQNHAISLYTGSKGGPSKQPQEWMCIRMLLFESWLVRAQPNFLQPSRKNAIWWSRLQPCQAAEVHAGKAEQVVCSGGPFRDVFWPNQLVLFAL